LVVVSHGRSNPTAGMSWLGENLASKGYVVAAIRHQDPPITDRSGDPETWLRRPLDIAFVARSLQETLAAEGLVDPTRTALVGYSMGGYGALTCAGAVLEPEAPIVKRMPGDLLRPYARGGAKTDAVRVPNVRAVVAISPAGGAYTWGAEGLRGVTAPLLVIAGDRDKTVGYVNGARAVYEAATSARRYLLTYRYGAHNLGLAPVPETMRSNLWTVDWFEDPVWRKDRIVAINLHFITAFLDVYVRGDASRSAYIDGLVPDGSAGQWPAANKLPYAAYSPGAGDITVWKGFQRRYAEGLEFLTAAPDPRRD
jgi:pimeloyl-ACP methyl ester carboxylesterase